jgi:hypothetical protein
VEWLLFPVGAVPCGVLVADADVFSELAVVTDVSTASMVCVVLSVSGTVVSDVVSASYEVSAAELLSMTVSGVSPQAVIPAKPSASRQAIYFFIIRILLSSQDMLHINVLDSKRQ